MEIKSWSPKLVCQLIQELEKNSRFLSTGSMRLSSKNNHHQKLTKIVGKPTSINDLHQMACHYFHCWDFALEAAALFGKNPSHNRFWYKALIIDCIKHLHHSGHSLSVKDIWRDHSKNTTHYFQNQQVAGLLVPDFIMPHADFLELGTKLS